jgi:hypothetical protein
MYQKFNAYSLERARWLSELSLALLAAQQLISKIEEQCLASAETRNVGMKIRALHAELECMNRIVLAEDRIVGDAWPLIEPAGG